MPILFTWGRGEGVFTVDISFFPQARASIKSLRLFLSSLSHTALRSLLVQMASSVSETPMISTLLSALRRSALSLLCRLLVVRDTQSFSRTEGALTRGEEEMMGGSATETTGGSTFQEWSRPYPESCK